MARTRKFDTCLEVGCDRPYYAKGRCRRHYLSPAGSRILLAFCKTFRRTDTGRCHSMICLHRHTRLNTTDASKEEHARTAAIAGSSSRANPSYPAGSLRDRVAGSQSMPGTAVISPQLGP
jgi:hypothetical protein